MPAFSDKLALPEFAWMAGKTTCQARATCSAKCIIRADWSLVGGFKAWLPPMQAKAIPVARGYAPVAQMSFASQVPPALAKEKGEDLIADRFSSKRIPEEPQCH